MVLDEILGFWVQVHASGLNWDCRQPLTSPLSNLLMNGDVGPSQKIALNPKMLWTKCLFNEFSTSCEWIAKFSWLTLKNSGWRNPKRALFQSALECAKVRSCARKCARSAAYFFTPNFHKPPKNSQEKSWAGEFRWITIFISKLLKPIGSRQWPHHSGAS